MKKLLLFFALVAAGQASGQKPMKVPLSDFTDFYPRRVTRAADKQGVKATLKYEQLSDMHTARIGHQTFPIDDGLVVVGGHTTGFKLTASAEQYKDGSWTEMGSYYAHDGAFTVMRGNNRYMIGGGFSEDNGVGQTKGTSIYNSFFPDRLLRNAYLTVPRAKSKAINVNGKLYVSGNWNADDNVMDCLDADADDFTSVGETDGRSNPYMFSDNKGRVIVLSAYDNYGKSFGFHTGADGTQLLVADCYDPSTGNTSLVGMPFSPQSVPMELSGDVISANYHVRFQNDNLYFIQAKEGTKYVLYALDSDEMKVYGFPEFDIPTVDNAGQAISWRGGVIANEQKEEVYLIGTSGLATNQTLHVISLNYLSQEWTIASATGFKHDLLTASWTLLNDGRLACSGGGTDTDAKASAYIITPSVAGRGDVEPDEGDLVDRKFLVVETKDHVQTTYMLAEKTQVRFVGANLRVVSSKADVIYKLSDILRFTYETRSVTGVSELRYEPATVDYTDGQLVVSGIKAGASVGVYSLDGKLVKQLTAEYTGTYRLSLSSLPQGVYIVKADNITYKIMKR